MKLVINKLTLAVLMLPCLLFSVANAQVEVSFVDSGQTVPETGEWTVGIELSEPSLIEVSVPYIVASSSTAVLDSDFEIAEDEEENGEITFDNESPIIFEPGETLKYVTITMINDDEVENDELLVLQLVSDGLTVAKLGKQTTHSIRILDNDPIKAYFRTHEADFSEDSNITASIRLTSASEQDCVIKYTITPLTADSNDIDLDNSYNSDNPITISAGSTVSTVALKVVNDSVTDRNEGGADRETVKIQITSASLEDGTIIDFDSEPFIATIVDNDPITVQFVYNDDLEDDFPLDLDEYNTTSLRVILLNPDGDATTAAYDITVPVTFGGGVVVGSGDNDDLDPDTDPIVISAGQSNTTLALEINNDDNIEEDELLTVDLGTPTYKDGGDLVLGSKDQMSFMIIDNDPVTLSFGAYYTKDDTLAYDDSDYEDIVYVDSAGSVVSESSGSVTIPIYLSSISANNTTFTLELLSDGTTATAYDSSGADDQDWDYAVSSHNLSKPGKSVSVSIRAGVQLATVTVTLNDDAETPTVYGQSPASDVEADEYVRFRISDVNTTDSAVSFGADTDYTLTIRDLPDIDITDLVSGLSPDSSYFENGGLRYDDKTGLFQAHYVMKPTITFDPSNFPGYRSMKFQYRTTNYDASNPDADSNDALLQSPEDPEEDEEFNFYVNTPYQVRYPAASEQIILKEGVDPVDNKYDITTADTIEIAPYLLRPLYFPRLNDFEAEIEGAFDINDQLDWMVNFYSQGYFYFPPDRIDPASNPNRLRVYLTTASTAIYASSGTTATISKFVPLPDGSVYMVIECGSAYSNVQIQYLDPGDEWRAVQPSYMSTGGGSKLYWVDQGPPQTQTHPKNVPFRLYRATKN